jgi:TolB-like protein
MKNSNDGVDSTGGMVGTLPAPEMVPVAKPLAGGRPEKDARRSKRKAAKLRAVWISFTGRIVAQFVGSAASIVLGMSLIHSYKAPAQEPGKATLASEPGATYQGRVARTNDAGGRPRPSIVVLPFDDYSQDAPSERFGQVLTEFVTASLAERDSLAVLSRTSAGGLGARHVSVPAIARELGVDLVLESSITRSANRLRVVAQLIDGRSDEHLWTGRYERESGEMLGVQSEIADLIARGIDTALGGLAQRTPATSSRSANARGGAKIVARALPAAEPPAIIPQH